MIASDWELSWGCPHHQRSHVKPRSWCLRLIFEVPWARKTRRRSVTVRTTSGSVHRVCWAALSPLSAQWMAARPRERLPWLCLARAPGGTAGRRRRPRVLLPPEGHLAWGARAGGRSTGMATACPATAASTRVVQLLHSTSLPSQELPGPLASRLCRRRQKNLLKAQRKGKGRPQCIGLPARPMVRRA